jgi:hypothetical protein
VENSLEGDKIGVNVGDDEGAGHGAKYSEWPLRIIPA